MIYLAFDKNDDFYVKESSTLFSQHLSATPVGRIDGTSVDVYHYDDPKGRHGIEENVIYYTGHGIGGSGMKKGQPIKLHSALEFVRFLIEKRIKVDRIVFLSCYAYLWLCRQYKDFSILLEFQDKILLEGSDGPMSMVTITQIVTKNLDSNGVFKGIFLIRSDSKLPMLHVTNSASAQKPKPMAPRTRMPTRPRLQTVIPYEMVSVTIEGISRNKEYIRKVISINEKRSS